MKNREEIEEMSARKTREWIAYHKHMCLKHTNGLIDHKEQKKLFEDHLKKLKLDAVREWET